jgi:gamma-glutamylcysteine synthetase
MNNVLTYRFNELSAAFTRQYMAILAKTDSLENRTYGLEYELLPDRPLNLDDMDRLYQFLEDAGMRRDGLEFLTSDGIRVGFEPGGQIEYISPPLKSADTDRMNTFLAFMKQTNSRIRHSLHIIYEARDFAPGRAHAPLCLTSPRYRMLHDRLAHTGTRGLEMMKGTASIHLHVNIIGAEELLLIFRRLCDMSISPEFRMSPQRRDIWDNTDPMRCGRPPCCNERLRSPEQLIERLVRFALSVEVLGENVIFPLSRDQSFSAFLSHMTTLFTDVRFNLKGPTLELRTLDSMPINEFIPRWDIFVSSLETIQ